MIYTVMHYNFMVQVNLHFAMIYYQYF